MTIGTVKFFNTSKGFGFIAPEGGGKDVFVHATAVEAAGMRTLTEGQKVSFDIVPDARGAKAANLKSAYKRGYWVMLMPVRQRTGLILWGAGVAIGPRRNGAAPRSRSAAPRPW